MEDIKIKEVTKLEKIALIFTLIGAAMTIMAVIIAALKINILFGIAISGIFLVIIGIAIIAINNK